MNLEHLNSYPAEKVRALLGLTVAALSDLLAKMLPELLRRRQVERVRRPGRQRAVGGGRRRRLKPYQEGLLTLIYLRHNVAHAVVGELFGVSAATSEKTFHEGVFVLRDVCPAQRWDAEKQWKKGEPSWTPDTVERALIDSFESPVRRPSLPAWQKRVYSGKKKPHTLKSQVVTEAQGEILDLDPGHRGPTADKRLYEQSTVAEYYPQAAKPGDLAYQGIAGVQGPHKKPRGGQLTAEQRAEKRRLAAVRVHVEHGIRRIKGWRIVRDDYRIALGLFPLIASTVVGLVQLMRIVG
jgi:DDE superfamily endonuclease/Helix-turn-helix of DDE superfamily endonuclease